MIRWTDRHKKDCQADHVTFLLLLAASTPSPLFPNSPVSFRAGHTRRGPACPGVALLPSRAQSGRAEPSRAAGSLGTQQRYAAALARWRAGLVGLAGRRRGKSGNAAGVQARAEGKDRPLSRQFVPNYKVGHVWLIWETANGNCQSEMLAQNGSRCAVAPPWAVCGTRGPPGDPRGLQDEEDAPGRQRPRGRRGAGSASPLRKRHGSTPLRLGAPRACSGLTRLNFFIWRRRRPSRA